ncbi:hypothetical protein D7V21_14685 [Acinetobacter guerrae]|uniref:Lipoprotein n=1 Tax=Acinetobacter guerrae TaxID=1843371 RepID=A0A3A8ECC0_9GAMM|nr:hypothetical protein D7V21_14685 [Acinetobacter guerrae]
MNLKFFYIIILVLLSGCNHTSEIENKKNLVDFNYLYYNGKVYSIGDQKNNILVFDAVNSKIQGIYLQEKDFSMSDCEK